MDFIFISLSSAVVLVIFAVVAILVREMFDQKKYGDTNVQNLVRQIRKEARKRNIDADDMIVNSLKRLLEEVKRM